VCSVLVLRLGEWCRGEMRHNARGKSGDGEGKGRSLVRSRLKRGSLDLFQHTYFHNLICIHVTSHNSPLLANIAPKQTQKNAKNKLLSKVKPSNEILYLTSATDLRPAVVLAHIEICLSTYARSVSCCISSIYSPASPITALRIPKPTTRAAWAREILKPSFRSKAGSKTKSSEEVGGPLTSS
jgi:hypothetical protein